VDSFGLVAALGGDREPVAHVDALDHEHVIVGLDLADGLDVVGLRVDFDLTRFQRAGKRAGQSAAGCGDDVVERGCVGRVPVGIDAVVLGDFGMYAERDRLGLGW
jgi:hypothetical protein